MEVDGRARFAEQLAARRAQAGLSLAEVASTAHVARGYVHHVEHGHRWPTQRVAQALEHGS
jgi:transcriptional regulator with XRE-family HTH domain